MQSGEPSFAGSLQKQSSPEPGSQGSVSGSGLEGSLLVGGDELDDDDEDEELLLEEDEELELLEELGGCELDEDDELLLDEDEELELLEELDEDDELLEEEEEGISEEVCVLRGGTPGGAASIQGGGAGGAGVGSVPGP